MMNPISGIIPESLFRNVPMMVVDIDEIDRNFEDSNSNWQQEDAKYLKEWMKPVNGLTWKKFIDDEMLNKIWYDNDRPLNHVPK